MGIVTLVVRDPRRGGAQKALSCELSMLTCGSGFFAAALAGVGPGQDARIDVECDADVFVWILRYMKTQHASGGDVAGCGAARGAAAAPAAGPDAPGRAHMQRRHQGGSGGSQELAVGNCLEILVAAEFLQVTRR
jgi:hypothetical protein